MVVEKAGSNSIYAKCPVHTPVHSPDAHLDVTSSVFAKAVLDNEIVEIIPSGKFEQIFARALPEGEVNLVGIE